ncbi:MAG: YafY family transcriptional regulator [Lachnospiraceae bacterium]|nr:YafY family transcriptional regulator [Lachnospiraceae bacterium]
MLSRLLNMVYLLMNKETVTAKELAERFEVSVRTVYRDVETLSMAGIPVYTRTGRNGGISLTEQFVLNKMLVTKEDQEQILAALASLRETGAGREDETLEKLGAFFQAEPQNWVSIDFSDWSGRRKEMFEEIRKAILSHTVLSFDYYGQYGEMRRRIVEPMQLLFKDYTWYLRAFCREREDMRQFKILRMKRMTMLEEKFKPRQIGFREENQKEIAKDQQQVGGEAFPQISLWIDKKEAYRIYDRFEEEEITVLPDGNFKIQMNCILDDWVYGIILSFGPSAKVLEPETVRIEIKRRIHEMGEKYAES